MNKQNDEKYIEKLKERDEGATMIDSIYKKKCGHCKNDLIQPYIFCRFCGYRIKNND